MVGFADAVPRPGTKNVIIKRLGLHNLGCLGHSTRDLAVREYKYRLAEL